MVQYPNANHLFETTGQKPPFTEVALTDSTAARLLESALGMPPGIYGNLVDRQNVLAGAPQAISDMLQASEAADSLRFLRDGDLTAVMVSGLPVDPSLPPSPIDGGVPVGKDTYVSEAMGLGIGFALGYPSLLLGEKEEALVHQITPVAGREKTQSNEGQVDLKFHQDLAAHPDFNDMPYDKWMPDWLVLTGVRAGAGITRTSIASLDQALTLVSPRTIEVLSDKRFVTNPPDSFIKQRGGEIPAWLPVHPVLRQYNGHFESAFDISSGLRPHDYRDREAAEALKQLEAAFTEVRQEVEIVPGTSVAFNNRRVVHGRGAVIGSASSDEKRWIQRVYVFDAMRMIQASGWYALTFNLGYVGITDSRESDMRILQLSGVSFPSDR